MAKTKELKKSPFMGYYIVCQERVVTSVLDDGFPLSARAALPFSAYSHAMSRISFYTSDLGRTL